MQPNVFWITGPWRGRLGVVLRPRGGDWLRDETTAWREAGIDEVVSLLEPEEEKELALEGEAAAAAASEVGFTAFPIRDRGVPPSRELVADLVNRTLTTLKTGRNVAVHCRQGIGRSALIVGAILVADGQDPDTAFRIVKEARGIDVPETVEQRQWLQGFASWLSSARPASAGAMIGRRD
jgi:protein-tyrosine phosphatase